MNTTTRLIAVFTVSAIGSATVALAKKAEAYTNYRRVASAACLIGPSWGNASLVYGGYGDIENHGPAESEIDFTCPVIDDQSMPVKNITNLWVDVVQEGAPYFWPSAAACTIDWSDTGGACGRPNNQAANNGHDGMQVDTSAWTSGKGFYPIVAVTIPGGGSAFMGYNTYY